MCSKNLSEKVFRKFSFFCNLTSWQSGSGSHWSYLCGPSVIWRAVSIGSKITTGRIHCQPTIMLGYQNLISWKEPPIITPPWLHDIVSEKTITKPSQTKKLFSQCSLEIEQSRKIHIPCTKGRLWSQKFCVRDCFQGFLFLFLILNIFHKTLILTRCKVNELKILCSLRHFKVLRSNK